MCGQCARICRQRAIGGCTVTVAVVATVRGVACLLQETRRCCGSWAEARGVRLAKLHGWWAESKNRDHCDTSHRDRSVSPISVDTAAATQQQQHSSSCSNYNKQHNSSKKRAEYSLAAAAQVGCGWQKFGPGCRVRRALTWALTS